MLVCLKMYKTELLKVTKTIQTGVELLLHVYFQADPNQLRCSTKCSTFPIQYTDAAGINKE